MASFTYEGIHTDRSPRTELIDRFRLSNIRSGLAHAAETAMTIASSAQISFEGRIERSLSSPETLQRAADHGDMHPAIRQYHLDHADIDPYFDANKAI